MAPASKCGLAILLTALAGSVAPNPPRTESVLNKRILALLPVATPSHHNVLSALTNELLERGHYVTIVSSGARKPKHPRLREILTNDPFKDLPNMSQSFFKGQKNIFQNLLMMLMIGPMFTKAIFENPEVLALKDEKFDLLITEAYFYQEPLLGFAYHFGCPSMVLYPVGYTTNINFFTGGSVNPSYVPNVFGSGIEPQIFLDRLKNTVFTVSWLLTHQLYYLPKADTTLHEVFPDAPPIQDLVRNISLILINNNNALMYPIPLAPSVIQVGGLHIKHGKPLPAELKKWIEDSKDGIVYFSLGSNLKANLLPVEKRDAIFASFGKLKQRVLVKWNGEIPPNAPKNCRFEEWVPQQEVLAHPNLKVFVTHGGLLSTQESVYYGAPIIGLPVYGDQYINIGLATKQGFALNVPLHELTMEALDAALNEVINNAKYSEKSKKLSLLFRLDPMPPLDKAVYYTEKLLELGSLKHLQPNSVKLYWYQYMLLDVVAVTLVQLVAVYITWQLIQSICSTCFRRFYKSLKTKIFFFCIALYMYSVFDWP